MSAYILEEKEFALLLQARGITFFQGFPLKHVPDTAEETLQVLFELTEKGFLISDGSSFQAEKEIAACMDILAETKGLLLLTPEHEEVPEYFCYPGKQVLVCQPAAFKPGAVKLWKTDWNELKELFGPDGEKTKIRYYKRESLEADRTIQVVRQEKSYLFTENGQEELVPYEYLGNVLKKLTEGDEG